MTAPTREPRTPADADRDEARAARQAQQRRSHPIGCMCRERCWPEEVQAGDWRG